MAVDQSPIVAFVRDIGEAARDVGAKRVTATSPDGMHVEIELMPSAPARPSTNARPEETATSTHGAAPVSNDGAHIEEMLFRSSVG